MGGGPQSWLSLVEIRVLPPAVIQALIRIAFGFVQASEFFQVSVPGTVTGTSHELSSVPLASVYVTCSVAFPLPVARAVAVHVIV